MKLTWHCTSAVQSLRWLEELEEEARGELLRMRILEALPYGPSSGKGPRAGSTYLNTGS